MGVLSDTEMRHRLGLEAPDPNRLEISPFWEFTKEDGHPSHGLGSYGYDLRLGTRFKYLDKHEMARRGIPYARPGMKNLPWVTCELTDASPLMVVPARSAVLAEVAEYIRVPRDCYGQIFTKSTWARLFIDLNTTPAEPEWCGVLTLEVTNNSDVDVAIERGEGIAQIVFYTANRSNQFPLAVSYADRDNPTYQNQAGVREATA